MRARLTREGCLRYGAAVALFFFDTNDGEAWAFDDEGRRCETLAEMRDHALQLMPLMAISLSLSGGQRIVRVRVRDEASQVVHRTESMQAPPIERRRSTAA